MLLGFGRRMRSVYNNRLSTVQRILFFTMLLASVGFSFRVLGKLGSSVSGKTSAGGQAFRSMSAALSATPKAQAQAAIETNKVMVFSKSYCPFCTKAKEALTKLNVQFEVLELDVVKDGDKIQNALEEMTKQRTVPNIFVKGQHVGGCDATLAKIADGSLQKMLA